MADTTVVISRSQLVFPEIGYTGGTTLEDLVKEMWEELGDNANSRYAEYTSIANSTTVELDHNFGAALSEYKILLYTGTGTNLTRIQDPVGAGWSIGAKAGEEKTVIEIETPSSGGPHTFTAIIAHGTFIESIDELDDVDISSTAPEEGQALVWETDKFVPGASGDSSLKFQSISGTDLVIKSGFIILSDGRELRLASDLTYDLSGITTNGDYYGYVDLNTLPSPTTYQGREVYALSSGNFTFSTTTPATENLNRYFPVGSIQRNAGTWENQQTLAVRRHDVALGSDQSLEYDVAYTEVGDVGDADQIKAGHELAAGSFPSGADVSWFNLEDLTDGNTTNGHDLTDTGSVPFTSGGIEGQTNSAATFNGTNQFLHSSDAHFNPGDTDFACGGWFKADDWEPTVADALFGQWVGGDQSFGINFANGNLAVNTTIDGSTVVSTILYPEYSAGWLFIVLKHDSNTNVMYLYIDNVLIGTHNIGGSLYTASSPNFILGGLNPGGQLFPGDIDEFFFINGSTLTDEQIHKIYSKKLSHNRSLSTIAQEWKGWVKSTDGIELPLEGFVVDLENDDLYYDLSDQESTNEVALKLHNKGAVGYSKPIKGRRIEATASEIDAILPLSHQLGMVPEISLKVSDGTDYEYHDAGSYFKSDADEIKSSGTTLASGLGASTPVILTYSSGYSNSTALPASSYNTISASSDVYAQTGDRIFMDNSGAGNTVYAPSSPSLGDEVIVIDYGDTFGTNSLTFDGNGNNVMGASSFTLSTDGDSSHFVFNGTEWRLQ